MEHAGPGMLNCFLPGQRISFVVRSWAEEGVGGEGQMGGIAYWAGGYRILMSYKDLRFV